MKNLNKILMFHASSAFTKFNVFSFGKKCNVFLDVTLELLVTGFESSVFTVMHLRPAIENSNFIVLFKKISIPFRLLGFVPRGPPNTFDVTY